MDAETKTIRELIFFYPDRRPGATHAVFGEPLIVDAAKGESVDVPLPDGYLIVRKVDGEVITIAPTWLWMTDQTREVKKYVMPSGKPTIVRSSD